MTLRTKNFGGLARVGASIVALALALGTAGCGGGDEAEQTPQTTPGDVEIAPGTYQLLSFFPQPNYDTWLRSQIKRFEEAHEGVTIKVQYTDPTNIIQKVKTGVAAAQAPDVATMLPGSAQRELWDSGRLLDYKPFIDADSEWQQWIKGWDKVPDSQYKAGENIFAANISLGPMVIWYWKDQLQQAGHDSFPEDIDGLIQLAKDLRAADLQPLAIGHNSQALFNFDYTFYTLEANFDPGGEKARLADEGKYPWTSPEFQQAAELYKRLHDEGVFYDGALEKNYDPDTKVDFGGKQAAMAWPFGPWMHGYYPEAVIPNVGTALFPRVDASAPKTLTGSNDLEFIIPVVTDDQKDPAHQRTMVEFVKLLNSPESQQELWAQGIFPVMVEASSSPSATPWAPVVKAQIDLAESTELTVDENTYSPNTDQALTNGLQAVLLGQMSVDEMLERVQEANKKDHPCAPDC
jgi:raffinose/stachyose/melibiose transport system substrate-binding protein